MKTVEKYQFNEEEITKIDGIQICQAKHQILNKKFTLKRIGLANHSDEPLYLILVKEVALLKKINHPSVYRCHKMLKTKNNAYLIYDSIQGNNLEKIIAQNYSIDKKISIARELTSVVVMLQSLRIIHLAINTQNIIINLEGTLKLINFHQGSELLQSQTEISYSPYSSVLTPFAAPQLSQGRACIASDIYSLGAIFHKLFEREFESKYPDDNSWVSQIHQMVLKMMSQFEGDRPSIKIVDAIIHSKPAPAQERLSIKMTTIKSAKSERVVRDDSPDSNLSGWSFVTLKHNKSQHDVIEKSPRLEREFSFDGQYKRQDKNHNKIKELVRKILKKRNFSVLVLQMTRAVLNNHQVKSSLCLVLAFLLLKKTTIVICQLAKLLKVGQCDNIIIHEKIKESFYRSAIVKRLIITINEQMQNTQRQFHLLVEKIKQVKELAEDTQLADQLKYQKIKNDYLRRTVAEFLDGINLTLTPECFESYQIDDLFGIYSLTLLSSYQTFEDAYDKLFSESGASLEKQPFVKNILQMDKQSIFQLFYLCKDVHYERELMSPRLVKSSRNVRV